MRRAHKHHPKDQAPALTISAHLTLIYSDRQRRRIRLQDDAGEAFLLDLERATYLGEGDLLELDDGSAILVHAGLEDVLEVITQSPEQTARIAWHIGNRHCPVQVLEGGILRLVYDHVLEHMLEGLGAHCHLKRAPFSPEPGAYQNQSTPSSHHSHDHGQAHDHGHAHH